MRSRSTLRTELLNTDLARLGFRPDDAAEFRRLAAGFESQPALVSHVEAVGERLRARIGRLDATEQPVSDFADPPSPEDGLIALMALVSIAPDVHHEYLRRGVPDEIAWKSLSDLGQQVHIHRLVHGRFGMSSQPWCTANYTGRLLWLGRLQFALQKDHDHAAGHTGSHVLGIHIPESGPLTPTDVDESLRMAQQIALPAFQDYSPRIATLHSWLLDPGINARLKPDSNMVRFTSRFELYGEHEDAYRDALFYGFHIEPVDRNLNLDALPQATSLQRAIVNQLRGEGVGLYSARLRDWPLPGPRP